MPIIPVSDKLVKSTQIQIHRQFGIEVAENRVRAALLLSKLQNEVNKVPEMSIWKLLWEYITRQDDLGLLFLIDLHTSIKNAQTHILLQLENPTWDHMVEEIQKYTLTPQSTLVNEYLGEVEKLLKGN